MCMCTRVPKASTVPRAGAEMGRDVRANWPTAVTNRASSAARGCWGYRVDIVYCGWWIWVAGDLVIISSGTTFGVRGSGYYIFTIGMRVAAAAVLLLLHDGASANM